MKFNDNIADDEWEWYIGQIFSRLIKNVHKSNIKNVVRKCAWIYSWFCAYNVYCCVVMAFTWCYDWCNSCDGGYKEISNIRRDFSFIDCSYCLSGIGILSYFSRNCHVYLPFCWTFYTGHTNLDCLE